MAPRHTFTAKRRDEQGEISSWLILAAGLTIAAMLASTILGATINALASDVGQPGAGSPSASGPGSPGGPGENDNDDPGGSTPAGPLDGSTTDIALDDGTIGTLRQGPDGRTSVVTVDDDGNVRVVHVDADGNIDSIGLEPNEDGDGWSLTDWHFEDRDELNTDLPPNLDDASSDGEWIRLEDDQAVFHDDPETDDPEIKFIHPDGREAVYNPETGELVTDPEFAGTYNYVNPAPMPTEAWDVGGWAAWAFYGAGHALADIVPYFLGGNVRGPDDAEPATPPANPRPPETDSDGDGVPNLIDPDFNPTPDDEDGDGVPNYIDPDFGPADPFDLDLDPPAQDPEPDPPAPVQPRPDPPRDDSDYDDPPSGPGTTTNPGNPDNPAGEPDECHGSCA